MLSRCEQCLWHGEAEALCCLEIDDQLKLRRLLDRQLAQPGIFEHAVYISGRVADYFPEVLTEFPPRRLTTTDGLAIRFAGGFLPRENVWFRMARITAWRLSPVAGTSGKIREAGPTRAPQWAIIPCPRMLIGVIMNFTTCVRWEAKLCASQLLLSF